MIKLPVGFRFVPSKEELLFYLQKKVKGEPLPYDVVPECDIYGDKEPWKVFDENSNQTFYAFTKLKKKTKLRIERKAGCGTWAGKQINDIEDDNGKHVGFNKYFVFEDEKGSKNMSHWVMHEFSLLDDEFNGYVICEIRNKDAVDKDKAQVKDLKHRINNTSDEQVSQSQRSKKRNLNPGQKNQQQKKERITSTMDNINVENRKDNGDPSLLPSSLILEPTPIQILESAPSSNFDYVANQFKEEDIMDSYLSLSNLITEPAPAQYMRPTSTANQFNGEDIMNSYLSLPNLITEPAPAQYMGPTTSSYNNYTAYEFGKDMMEPCMMEPNYLPQSSLNVEPAPALEWTQMMLSFDLETREAIDAALLMSYNWVDQQQLPCQLDPVNGNFQT